MIEWMPIPIFNGEFMASIRGEIKNTVTGTLLKFRADKRKGKGYLRVNIYYDGLHKTHSVHRLVLMAFKGLCVEKNQVNHRDGNKSNNHIENLEWCTGSENILHAQKTGLKPLPTPPKFTPENNPHNKKVEHNGVVYNSVEIAAKILGLSSRGIASAARGSKKTYKGLTFKYIDNE
jgi:hypothetical protein